MISVKEAKQLIQANTSSPQPVSVELSNAAGLVLAEDIYAIVDVPAFDQSAMDGYAIQMKEKNTPLRIDGESPAGASDRKTLRPGTCIRIFTGAPVPQGADTVVMQEKVSKENNCIIIKDESLQKGRNIRLRGSEVAKDTIALQNGSILSPAAIGLLACCGIEKVNVFIPPKIAIIVTGQELVTPGAKLEYGQAYESNSFSLHAALQRCGITEIFISRVEDSLTKLVTILTDALQSSDIILLTGGVSVGDYDFVLRATEICGVNKIFHKIKQKPGKPLYVGKKENKIIFGLPGNPGSALTCFYEYVISALEIYMNKKNTVTHTVAILNQPTQKSAGLTHFLKGHYDKGRVDLLSAQESYRMSSFALSNCLVVLPEEETYFAEGTEAEVHLFPV